MIVDETAITSYIGESNRLADGAGGIFFSSSKRFL